MARIRTIRRRPCGFCAVNAAHKHQYCPGTLTYGPDAAPKTWMCWCHENGHPAMLPEGPIIREVKEAEMGEGDEGPQESTKTRTEPPEGKGKGPRTEEPKEDQKPKQTRGGERCGHPTNKGPCKRRAGHTRGHDAR